MAWSGPLSEQRMRFVGAYQSGRYSMSELCREFGISRPTGYKWVSRGRECASSGFEDRSSAPHRHPNATSSDVVDLVVEARERFPQWGARKLKLVLEREHPSRTIPAASTIGLILKKHGLVEPRRYRRRCPPYTDPLRHATAPNDVWCIDFKGDIGIGGGLVVKPFTVTDAFSRYLLFCDVLPTLRGAPVLAALTQTFDRFGLPAAIRSDNGPPFASRGLAGLSAVSVSLLRLGITVERIEPGKPQQNGRHERFHRTLEIETSKPLALSVNAQRQRFARFVERYNNVRPHEALDGRVPADVYLPSKKRAPEKDYVYPAGFETRKVDVSGRFSWHDHPIRASKSLCGETLGLEPIDDNIWRVWFRDQSIGVFDAIRRKVFDHPPRSKCKQSPRSVL